MRPADKKVEDMLLDIKHRTRPELDEKILAQCFDELDDFKFRAVKPSRFKLFIRSRITKIAAAVLIATGLLVLKNIKQPAARHFALNQTLNALATIRSIRMPVDNGRSELLMLIDDKTGKPDHIRMDAKDSGDVTITIPGQTYVYNKDKNQINFLSQELLYNNFNLRDAVNSIITQSNTKECRVEISDQVEELTGKLFTSVSIIREDKSLAGRLVIDPETKLPIYLTIDICGSLTYLGPIEYNVDYPDSAFAFIIPEGAKVIEQTTIEGQIQKPKQAELGPINGVIR